MTTVLAWLLALLALLSASPGAHVIPSAAHRSLGLHAASSDHAFRETPLVLAGGGASYTREADHSNLPAFGEAEAAGRTLDAPPLALSGPLTVTGIASYVLPKYGPTYLALPAGRGIAVSICTAIDCVYRVSTDKGPVASLHRVADLSWWDFRRLCGGCDPAVPGLMVVTVTRLPRPPATSTR